MGALFLSRVWSSELLSIFGVALTFLYRRFLWVFRRVNPPSPITSHTSPPTVASITILPFLCQTGRRKKRRQHPKWGWRGVVLWMSCNTYNMTHSHLCDCRQPDKNRRIRSYSQNRLRSHLFPPLASLIHKHKWMIDSFPPQTLKSASYWFYLNLWGKVRQNEANWQLLTLQCIALLPWATLLGVSPPLSARGCGSGTLPRCKRGTGQSLDRWSKAAGGDGG